VRELTRELRDVKRDAREASFGLSPDELTEQAGRELDELEGICEFLRKFRDGKITLAELVRGPPQTSHRDADDLGVPRTPDPGRAGRVRASTATEPRTTQATASVRTKLGRSERHSS